MSNLRWENHHHRQRGRCLVLIYDGVLVAAKRNIPVIFLVVNWISILPYIESPPTGKATCVVCLPKRRKLSSEARARSHEIEELRISNENLERQQEALKFYSAQQDQEIAVLKQQCYLLLELSRTQVQYTTAIDPSAANRELNMITRETWQTMMNQAGNGAGSVPAPLTLPEQRVASFSTVLQPPVSVTSDAIENSDCNMARGVKRLHDDVGESFGIDHGEGLGYADSMLDSPWEDMELPDSLFPENFHNAVTMLLHWLHSVFIVLMACPSRMTPK